MDGVEGMRKMGQVEMWKGDFELGKCNVLLKGMLSENHVTLMCCYRCNNGKPIFHHQSSQKMHMGDDNFLKYHDSKSLANASFTPNVKVSCQHQKSAFS